MCTKAARTECPTRSCQGRGPRHPSQVSCTRGRSLGDRCTGRAGFRQHQSSELCPSWSESWGTRIRGRFRGSQTGVPAVERGLILLGTNGTGTVRTSQPWAAGGSRASPGSSPSQSPSLPRRSGSRRRCLGVHLAAPPHIHSGSQTRLERGEGHVSPLPRAVGPHSTASQAQGAC